MTDGMFLQFNIQHRSIFESPFDNVSLRAGGGFFDVFCGFDGGPETVKGLEFDEMPDLCKWGGDDCSFKDGGGCWD